MAVRGTELYSFCIIACFPLRLWCLTSEMDYVLLCEPKWHLLPIPTSCVIQCDFKRLSLAFGEENDSEPGGILVIINMPGLILNTVCQHSSKMKTINT